MAKCLLQLLLLISAGPVSASECIVLLHGLWRTDASMNKMQRKL